MNTLIGVMVEVSPTVVVLVLEKKLVRIYTERCSELMRNNKVKKAYIGA
jgi:hypothetical protein